MGAENTFEKATYYSAYDGRWVTRVDPKVYPHAIARTVENVTTKETKVVHELSYDTLSGFITSIVMRESTYGKRWKITLKDNEGTYVIDLPYSCREISGILMRMPNVDFARTVKVHISSKIDVKDAKKKTFCWLTQNAETVPNHWTKDNPGDLPPMIQIKIKGKLEWDATDQLEFLEGYIKNVLLPKMDTATHVEAKAEPDFGSDLAAKENVNVPPSTARPAPIPASDMPEDDLPF